MSLINEDLSPWMNKHTGLTRIGLIIYADYDNFSTNVIDKILVDGKPLPYEVLKYVNTYFNVNPKELRNA